MAQYTLAEMQGLVNEAQGNFDKWSSEVVRLHNVQTTAANSSGGCRWKPTNASTKSVSNIPPSRGYIYKKSSDSSSGDCNGYKNAFFDAEDALVIANAKVVEYKALAKSLGDQLEVLKKTVEVTADVQGKTEDTQLKDSKQFQVNVTTIVVTLVVGIAVFLILKLVWK